MKAVTTVACAALTLLLAPTVDAKERIPVQPGPENDFGLVDFDPIYPKSEGERVPLEARVQLKEWEGSEGTEFVLLAFIVKTEAVRVNLTGVEDPEGNPVTMHQDDRGLDPKIQQVLVPRDESPNGSFILLGTVSAHENGRFHLGALAIAFDSDWRKMRLPTGHSAEVYGSAEVTGEGFETGAFEPPFRGDGNYLPGAGFVAALVATFAVAVSTRRLMVKARRR